MKKCCIEINGLPWHCFSIYYTSNEWHRILPNIIAYMKEHWDIYQYMLFLSVRPGRQYQTDVCFVFWSS